MASVVGEAVQQRGREGGREGGRESVSVLNMYTTGCASSSLSLILVNAKHCGQAEGGRPAMRIAQHEGTSRPMGIP